MDLHPLQTFFSFIFFSFTLSFSIFSILLLILRARPWCHCEVCRTYLASSWSTEFDNLSDWYTHLLRNSSNQTIHIHVLGNTITANPENVEYMLKTKFDNYPKGKPFSTILGDLLGRGIFNVDGQQWRFQRKMASLELGSISVRSFAFEIVSTEIRGRLVPLLASVAGQKDTVLDLQDVFRRFAFDNICKISFGLDPNCLDLTLPISEFALAFDVASKLSAKRATSPSPLIWKLKRLLNIGSEKTLREAIKLVNVLAEEVIRERRKMGGFSNGQDLLSRFMGTINDDDSYLRDIVISFLLAGRDTVASALTSFCWLVARHPEVEALIVEEVEAAMAGGGETKEDKEDVTAAATFLQLKEMHYLHASLYEAMRLYPPVQFDSKFSSADDVLPDGTFVKKGTRLTYHPYAMGRLEQIWGSDCLQFRPQRWLKDGVFSPQSPFKYPVFQGGLRVCLGKEMAIMEMKSVAASLLRRFEIRLLEPVRNPKFATGLTATISGGLPVLVRERSRRSSRW